MKRRYWWIAGALVLLVLIIIPFSLLAQSQEVPPPPPFPSPDISPAGEDTIQYPEGKPPTATPNAEEVKDLPFEEPPVQPTAQMIDVAPDVKGSRYEIIIQRGEGGTTVLLVPLDMKEEEVLDKYLDREKGDTYYVAPPAHGEPPQVEQ